MKVRAQQNDNLDAILYRHLGKSQGYLEASCALNPHLMHQPIIPVGTVVNLPDVDEEQQSVAQDTLQLWS